MADPKPCPHCGRPLVCKSDPADIWSDDGSFIVVHAVHPKNWETPKCGYRGVWAETEEEAIALANRRAVDPMLAELVREAVSVSRRSIPVLDQLDALVDRLESEAPDLLRACEVEVPETEWRDG